MANDTSRDSGDTHPPEYTSAWMRRVTAKFTVICGTGLEVSHTLQDNTHADRGITLHIINRPARDLLAGFLLLGAVACSDSTPLSSPEISASSASTDTLSTVGGPGSVERPFVPATAIDLAVTVGSAVAGQDTLAYTPLANATVKVFSRTLVHSNASGRDTLSLSENEVARGTTNAAGEVSFAALPAVAYRIEAALGAGSPWSLFIAPPYPEDVRVRLIVRPPDRR
jgi:hypothetical protein